MHSILSVFRNFGPGIRPGSKSRPLLLHLAAVKALHSAFALFLFFAVSFAPAPALRAAPSEENAQTSPGAVPARSAPAQTEQPTLMPSRGGVAVGHSMQSLIDASGKLNIEDILNNDNAHAFAPLDMRSLPRQTGAVWLRLPLGKLSAAELGTGLEKARLDLGDQVPGTPQVWVRAGESHTPRPVTPDENGLYPLPGLHQGGEAIVRLEGLPGLWFSPSLRAPADALNAPERRVHSLALATLTVLLMLAFVRSITERGDGRIWAGIFAGAALIQAFWGVPSTPEGSIRPLDMPGILAAAIALMLLPHVGRNIMRTRSCAPAVDVLLLILALPGAALALLPILPGQAWTARLLSLWPLGALFALLPALLLLLRREKGSFLFSLACFAMAAGSLIGLWGMGDTQLTPLWGQAPLIGVCIAALLLAAAAPRSAYTEIPLSPADIPDGKSPAELLEIEHFGPIEELPPPLEVSLGEVEETLREPLDHLMRECCALDRGLRLLEEPAEGETALPEAALDKVRRSRADAEHVLNAATALAGRIARLSLAEQERPASRDCVFDLRQLVQLAFSSVQADAAEKNLGLSWYIAPHIALRYRGDSERLSRVLAALLTDAVRATEKGNVCLRVRREDRSANPGHLQFTVADTGRGAPPVHRSSLALAHAWELATEHGGDLFVDSTPHGVEISFSLNCTALDAEDRAVSAPPAAPADSAAAERNVSPGSPLIILASTRSLNRQMFAWQLRGDDHETWEARDCAEAVTLYKNRPAALLVLDGHMPEDDIIRAVAGVRLFEGEHSLPLVPVLGLALDAEQGERLRRAGCEYLLYHPLGRQELRDTARALLAGESPAPQGMPSAISMKNRAVPPVPQAGSGTPLSSPDAGATAVPRVAASSGTSSVLSTVARSDAQANAQATTPAPYLKNTKETTNDTPSTAADMPETASEDAPADTAAERTASPRESEIRPKQIQTAQPPAQDTASRATGGLTASSVPFRSPSQTTPGRDTADAGAALSDKAEAQTTPRTGQTPHAASLPLAAPPSPGIRGWLSSFFKPKPRITPQNSSVLPSSGEGQDEWVGEPVPVRAIPDAGGKKTTPDAAADSTVDASSVASPEALRFLSLQPDSRLSIGKEETQRPPTHASAPDMPEILPDMQSDPQREHTPLLNILLEYPDSEHDLSEKPGSARPKFGPATESAAGQDEMEQENPESLEAVPLSNVEAMPFLTMLPGGAAAPRDDSDEIVNLTEDDMVLPGPLIVVERRFAESSGVLFTEKQDMEEMLSLERSESAVDARPADLAGIRKDVRESLTSGDAVLLTRAAAQLRDCAEHFGLHTLADLAYLLEESAHDGDFEAVRLIMPDLDVAVDRELARAAEQEI